MKMQNVINGPSQFYIVFNPNLPTGLVGKVENKGGRKGGEKKTCMQGTHGGQSLNLGLSEC